MISGVKTLNHNVLFKTNNKFSKFEHYTEKILY